MYNQAEMSCKHSYSLRFLRKHTFWVQHGIIQEVFYYILSCNFQILILYNVASFLQQITKFL